MADTSELVDRIRAFLQGSDQTLRDFVPGMAAAYAEACAEVNQRLGQCDRLLQKGLRSEAIHLADAEPNLLEALATLDFPERSDWEALVALYQLAEAPALIGVAAEALNAAYAEEDPLRDLMRRHRLLALSRMPLPPRLEVMRKIAALDPNNPVWPEDIRTFEQARWLQLQGEAAEIGDRRDLAGLLKILDEVEKGPWIESPPTPLVQGLRRIAKGLGKAKARQGLASIEEALNEAFATMDAARGREARQRWDNLLPEADLPQDDPLRDRADPALKWLDYEDRREQAEQEYQEAVLDLEEALDGRAGLAELDRLGHAVLRDERGIPNTLEARYRERLSELRASSKFRRQLIAGAAALAVALLGGLGIAAQRQGARARAVERATALFDQYLRSGEIEKAADSLDALADRDPDLAGEAAIVQTRARLREAQIGDQARASLFARALAEAEGSDVSQAVPPALETARSLARLVNEKSTLESMTKRRAIAAREDRIRREEVATKGLVSLQKKLESLEDQAREAENPGKTEALYRDVREDVDALAPLIGRLDGSTRTSILACVSRVEEIRRALDRAKRAKVIEAAVTQAVAYSPDHIPEDASAFGTALMDYAEAQPNSPRATSLKTTLGERSHWDAALAWRKVASGWSISTRLDPQVASLRAGQCRKFLAAHPHYPENESILAYKNYAESIARREEARGRLLALFSDAMMDNLLVVHADDRSFYLTEKPKSGAHQIRYLIDFQGGRRTMSFRDEPVATSAPQSRIAPDCKKLLREDSILVSWEPGIINLAENVARARDIDPLLQMVLFNKIATSGSDGSEPLRVALAGHRTAIERGALNLNLPWMDPESPEADRARVKARDVLSTIPPWPPCLKVAKEFRERVEREVAAVPITIGWLSVGGGGWHVKAGDYVPTQGDLWVLVPAGAKGAQWRRVGDLSGGKPRLDDDGLGAMAEGRPVFLMKRESGRS